MGGKREGECHLVTALLVNLGKLNAVKIVDLTISSHIHNTSFSWQPLNGPKLKFVTGKPFQPDVM